MVPSFSGGQIVLLTFVFPHNTLRAVGGHYLWLCITFSEDTKTMLDYFLLALLDLTYHSAVMFLFGFWVKSVWATTTKITDGHI